jgi:hypothetical protein
MEKIGRLELPLNETSHPVLFNGRNRVFVVFFPFSGGKTVEIAIKEFFVHGFLTRIKTFIMPSKAQKAWWGGVSLMQLGIPTPMPVCYLESSRSPFARECCYMSVFEEGVEEIRHLFRRLPPQELRSLVRALAHHMRRCHQKGILHRDLSDGNILVKKGENGEFTFFMIDTNRIRIRKKLGRWQRVKNLVRLGIPRQYQRLFLAIYSGQEDVKKGTWFWYRFRKNSYTGYVELKKKLFIRPKSITRNSG